MSLIIYLCSKVKASAVHNISCRYGHAENVQKEVTILTARKKYSKLTRELKQYNKQRGGHKTNLMQ